MIKKYHFKKQTEEGDIFLQLRYYTPFGNDNCYEGLILRFGANTFGQSIEYFSEKDFNDFSNRYSTINVSEFESIQEHKVFGGSKRQAIFKEYFDQWKDYYLLKKKSVENTRNSKPADDWIYGERIENEYRRNGVYEARQALKNIATQLEDNPSLLDVFREAKHQATNDYVRNRI